MDVLDQRLHELADQLGGTTPEPHTALARQASRVHRRRWLARAGAGTLALVVAVTVVVTLRPDDATRRIETPRTPPTPMTGTQLGVDDGHDSLVLHDLDAGTSRTVTVPGKATGDYPYSLLRVGDWIVYPGDGVQAIRADFSGSPVSLGPATVFVPSAREGWVWLVTFAGASQSAQTVQEVRVDGTERGPTATLPSGMFARVGVPGGLLIGNDTSVVKWDQATEAIGDPLFDSSAGLIDARGNTVAWGLQCTQTSTCGSVRVLDVSSGSHQDFTAPIGTSGWIPTFGEGSRDALSSDGRYLAVRAGSDVPAGENHPPTSTLYVIDLQDNHVTEVARSTTDYAFSRVAWSPDGNWVFSETNDHAIGAYRPGTGENTSYPGSCCGVALITVATTHTEPSVTTSTTPTTTPTAASSIATEQPTFGQQVERLETWYHNWPAEAPGGRPVLAAEYTYCDYRNDPGLSVANAMGLNPTSPGRVEAGFSSYSKLSEPLTEARVVDGCYFRPDRFPGGSPANIPVETPADQLPAHLLCATNQRGPNYSPAESPSQPPLKPAVVFGGTDCASAGFQAAPPNFIAELDQRRRIEIELRAVPKACPTAEEATQWAQHVTQQELGAAWQVLPGGQSGCFRPQYIDWDNHQLQLWSF
jgi:hypothetical protein